MLYENIKKGADIKVEYGSNTTTTASAANTESTHAR